jgi:hypothetical protein
MEVLLEIKSKEGDNLDGIMAKFILANGKKEKSTALDYGHPHQEIAIWDNGEEVLLREKEFIHIIMDKNMKVLLKNFLNTDMGNSDYQMVIPMKANIVKANLMVMACMFGKMERLMKELLCEEFVKGWEP